MRIDTISGNIILFIALANDLITSWEAGRQAASQEGSYRDNPYRPDSRDYDEWNRGFAHGVSESKVPFATIQGCVEAQIPSLVVEHLPERSFWAIANQVQISHGLEDVQLAARIGIPCDFLRSEMIRHHFWDDDGIPLGIRQAS